MLIMMEPNMILSPLEMARLLLQERMYRQQNQLLGQSGRRRLAWQQGGVDVCYNVGERGWGE